MSGNVCLFSDLQQQPYQQMKIKSVTNRSQEHISFLSLLSSFLGVVFGDEIIIRSAHKSNLSLIPPLTFGSHVYETFVVAVLKFY